MGTFKDHRVARLSFDIIETVIEPAIPIDKCTSNASNSSAGSTSTAITADFTSNVGTSLTVGDTPASGTATSTSVTSSTNAAATSSCASAATAVANRTAKIRRVMMTARRPGGFCGRAGVIVDRARPLVPVSSVPEELIAQAQVAF